MRKKNLYCKFAPFYVLIFISSTTLVGCSDFSNENKMFSGKEEKYKNIDFKKNKIDKINQDLKNYDDLESDQKLVLVKAVIEEVKTQRELFSSKIQNAKCSLKNLNLILGITGAGKTTLFNYLNGYPLQVTEVYGEARLEVDKKKLTHEQLARIAPISHTNISETTIPNFSKSATSDVVYVDCAGEFDNKDILQSIINSYFKCDLAKKSEQIKLTLAVNYSDLIKNRTAGFNQLLKQVNTFIGNWEIFKNSKSISIVVTNVASDLPDADSQIIIVITDIAKEVKDLGNFKLILEDICNRKAIALFEQPAKTITNIQKILEDDSVEPEYCITVGKEYKPKNNIWTAEAITKILEERSDFLKKTTTNDKIFTHNLPPASQKIVEHICTQLFEPIVDEAVSILMDSLHLSCMTTDNDKNKIKKDSSNVLKIIGKNRDIDYLFQTIKIDKRKLSQYNLLKEELLEFSTISNLSNVNEKICEKVETNIKGHINFFLKKIAEQEAKKAEYNKQQAEIEARIAAIQAERALLLYEIERARERKRALERERERKRERAQQQREYEAAVRRRNNETCTAM